MVGTAAVQSCFPAGKTDTQRWSEIRLEQCLEQCNDSLTDRVCPPAGNTETQQSKEIRLEQCNDSPTGPVSRLSKWAGRVCLVVGNSDRPSPDAITATPHLVVNGVTRSR
jgi:hypothetical protein